MFPFSCFLSVSFKAADVVGKSSVKYSVLLEDGKDQSLEKKVNLCRYE